MKTFARIAVASFAAIAGSAASFAGEVDGIAARVGTETILKSDVSLEMRRLRAPESDYVKIRNEMIDRKLILKAASAAKMTMQEWVVENRIRDIVDKAFGGDRNKLMDTLARQKISYPEWHARMKEDMIVSAMRWNVIDKNAVASPAAMRKEFAENPDRYRVGANVTVSVILLKPEDMGKREDVAAMIRGRRRSVEEHRAGRGVQAGDMRGDFKNASRHDEPLDRTRRLELSVAQGSRGIRQGADVP